MINLKNIKTINVIHHFSYISNFPSGNIIIPFLNHSIIIYDKNFIPIQVIENAHDKLIGYLNIKNENNFVSCSLDTNIKTWIKLNNNFELNKIIIHAHDSLINQVKYYSDKYLISCSNDNTVKIWEEINSKYQCNVILTHSKHVKECLLIEDKNILISSGSKETKILNLNNLSLIYEFNDICNTSSRDNLIRLNEDLIISKSHDSLIKIFSLSEKRIIKEFNNHSQYNNICLSQNKKFCLISEKQDIKIYSISNFECLNVLNNAHSKEIICLYLINGIFITYGKDKLIKIWSI